VRRIVPLCYPQAASSHKADRVRAWTSSMKRNKQLYAHNLRSLWLPDAPVSERRGLGEEPEPSTVTYFKLPKLLTRGPRL
jgi:hypothetical protein